MPNTSPWTHTHQKVYVLGYTCEVDLVNGVCIWLRGNVCDATGVVLAFGLRHGRDAIERKSECEEARQHPWRCGGRERGRIEVKVTGAPECSVQGKEK